MKLLDINAKQKVGYCIPNWLRDEQIRVNTAAVKGRIEPHYDKRTDPIALVNFGPSLQDTWEQIRAFRYVMTCSGAHKFLVERGIIPTHHADVDPRPHKVQLIGQPQHGCEYLIASTCHPSMFAHLRDYNTKLWHIFDTTEEGLRVLPPGEWALTGGCSVGVRLLTLARFLGFRDLHVFGMDGNAREGGKHAADHPNRSEADCEVEYNGVRYRTTPAMLEAARNTWHELDMLKDVTVQFYGEGLVQAMAKDYVRKELDGQPLIGFNKPELISDEYRKLNAQLHNENLAYGVGGAKHAETVKRLVTDTKAESVLDYGCGKSYLSKALPFPIWEYDPAIPGKDAPPRPADLVVCTDVLEHIEPDYLTHVLGDLARCVKKIGYFVIYTQAAKKQLPDGRNTHLIQEGKEWWTERLRQHFTVGQVIEHETTLHVVVGPLKRGKEKVA